MLITIVLNLNGLKLLGNQRVFINHNHFKVSVLLHSLPRVFNSISTRVISVSGVYDANPVENVLRVLDEHVSNEREITLHFQGVRIRLTWLYCSWTLYKKIMFNV